MAARKMNDEIVAIYCLCDDILRAMNHQGDKQQKMSDSEVMTTAIVAVLYFGGNFEKARRDLPESQYIPKMLSRSRFNRRLHRIEPMLLMLSNASVGQQSLSAPMETQQPASTSKSKKCAESP